MDEPNSTRRYHSPRRQEGAEATRRKVLDAAHRLFTERGYAATTLPAIAAEAGVSTPTVTAVFRTKPALLQALIQRTVRGDAAPEPLAMRPPWQAMMDEPDPVRQIAMFAAMSRRIHQQTTDIFEIVRGAATADPELAALRQQLGVRRLGDMRTMAESLHQKQALCPGMEVDEATDLIWALASAEMFRLLVVERQWLPDRYEGWLAKVLRESVMCPDGKPG